MHFFFFDGDTIEADNRFFAMAGRPTNHKCCQLEHLKHQNLIRKTNQLMEVRSSCMTGYDTYFILVLTSTEINLSRTERQDVTYFTAASRGRPLQLPLFLHKGLVLSPAGFKFAPSGPNFLQQKPIQQFVNQLERATSSPPTTVAGQKQLIPCPITVLEGTVDRIQFTNSSRM